MGRDAKSVDKRPAWERRPTARRAGVTALCLLLASFALLFPGRARAQETGDPILSPCSHVCLSSLRFARAYGQLDKLTLHMRILPISAIDPATEAVTVGLQNVVGTIAGETLPAGSIEDRENGLYDYNDPQARKAGGIAKFKIRPRKDALGGYRVDVVMYGDYSLATDPAMSTVILIGDDLFNNIGTWTQTKHGWVYEFPS